MEQDLAAPRRHAWWACSIVRWPIVALVTVVAFVSAPYLLILYIAIAAGWGLNFETCWWIGSGGMILTAAFLIASSYVITQPEEKERG